MNDSFSIGGTTFTGVLSFELCLVFLLTGRPYWGKGGKEISRYLCQAPGLDVVVSLIIWLPWVVAFSSFGWAGLGGCLLGQFVAMQLWIVGHELLNYQYRKEPRINSYLNKQYGWWRN